MFNVGRLIKIVSIVLFLVILILSLFGGVIVLNSIPSDINTAYIILYYIVDFIVIFVLFLLFYGFGALIDTNYEILKRLKKWYYLYLNLCK